MRNHQSITVFHPHFPTRTVFPVALRTHWFFSIWQLFPIIFILIRTRTPVVYAWVSSPLPLPSVFLSYLFIIIDIVKRYRTELNQQQKNCLASINIIMHETRRLMLTNFHNHCLFFRRIFKLNFLFIRDSYFRIIYRKRTK